MSYTIYNVKNESRGMSLACMDLCRVLALRGLTECPAAHVLSTFNCATANEGVVIPAHKARAVANSILLAGEKGVQQWMDEENAWDRVQTEKQLAQAQAADNWTKVENLRRHLTYLDSGKGRFGDSTAADWFAAAKDFAQWLLAASKLGSVHLYS